MSRKLLDVAAIVVAVRSVPGEDENELARLPPPSQRLGRGDGAADVVPAAVSAFERSVRVWRTRGSIPYLARTLRALGDAYGDAGDHDKARAVWEEARELFRGISHEEGLRTLNARLG